MVYLADVNSGGGRPATAHLPDEVPQMRSGALGPTTVCSDILHIFAREIEGVSVRRWHDALAALGVEGAPIEVHIRDAHDLVQSIQAEVPEASRRWTRRAFPRSRRAW